MKHPKASLLGAAAGLMAGLMLTPAPLTARRSSTRLTWDGSSCPAGTYTVTSTATNLSTAQSFVASMSGVALPRATVLQDFPNLPTGSYSVIASLASDNGLSFSSQSQTVDALDTSKSAPAAPTIDSTASGRQRPSSAPILGVAQPRETPPPPIGYSAGSPRAASKMIESIAPDPAPQVVPQVVTKTRAVLVESLLRVLAVHEPSATMADGDRLKMIDTDGDGIIDLVGVTIGGEVWFVRVGK
jgi:hypothetical protein